MHAHAIRSLYLSFSNPSHIEPERKDGCPGEKEGNTRPSKEGHPNPPVDLSNPNKKKGRTNPKKDCRNHGKDHGKEELKEIKHKAPQA
jgi:hypothetical protein